MEKLNTFQYFNNFRISSPQAQLKSPLTENDLKAVTSRGT